MRVRYRTNVGSVDAGRLGLKLAECVEGCECDVKQEIGEQLCARGLAIEIPALIKAVPPAPSIKGQQHKER